MNRNTLFGGLALMLAGGAIGAGTMISSNAMAETDGAPPANEVIMVNVGADGDAVKCTFSGAEIDGMFQAAAAEPIDGVGSSDLTGAVAIDPRNLPDGVTFGASVLPADVEVVTGEIAVEVATDEVAVEASLPEGVQVLSPDDARDGTPEECAAMREQAETGVPADVSMVMGTAVAPVTTP